MTPFVKVKDLITDLINRLQAGASSEMNQKSCCDEETSKATEKKEDLEADVAKHSSKLEAAVARSIVLDGEISALQSELGVLLNRQLQMDIMCAVERYILAKVTADFDRTGFNSVWWNRALKLLSFHSSRRLVHQTREKTQQAANTHVSGRQCVERKSSGRKSTSLLSTSRIRRFSSRTS